MNKSVPFIMRTRFYKLFKRVHVYRSRKEYLLDYMRNNSTYKQERIMQKNGDSLVIMSVTSTFPAQYKKAPPSRGKMAKLMTKYQNNTFIKIRRV